MKKYLIYSFSFFNLFYLIRSDKIISNLQPNNDEPGSFPYNHAYGNSERNKHGNPHRNPYNAPY